MRLTTHFVMTCHIMSKHPHFPVCLLFSVGYIRKSRSGCMYAFWTPMKMLLTSCVLCSVSFVLCPVSFALLCRYLWEEVSFFTLNEHCCWWSVGGFHN